MAGFFYGFGVSLIHMALLVGALFVKPANFDVARSHDQAYFKQLEDMQPKNASLLLNSLRQDPNKMKLLATEYLNVCENQAHEFTMLMNFLIAMHIYAIMICLYRELFEVKIGTIGGVMRFLEVIGVGLYLSCIIMCLAQFSFWMYEATDNDLRLFAPISNTDAMKLVLRYHPTCLTDRGNLAQWAGGTMYWFICEIVVHITYVGTLVILMAKSRFISVGIDNTQQFQPMYLSFLANYIIKQIPFDFH